MKAYNHKKIEKRWQKKWEENGLYKVGDPLISSGQDKPKYYVLDMFPYPSGDGLHVGHPKGYIATDILARMKMMQGYNVLHPMGWDAFGLPAENYAIKNKIHPRKAVKKNIKKFKSQLEKIGFTYDWSREINTTDPEFYKITQWMFLQMFKKGLAYESNEPVNWCPGCKTILANEDLENGKCERCGAKIEKKSLRQWVLKITDYADRLLKGLDDLDWEDSIKEMQRNWIGKSSGAKIKFLLQNSSHKSATSLEVFTTRPDTLFGCTYMVVAPENSIISEQRAMISNYEEVEKYIKQAKNKSDLERTDLAKEKTGVELKGIKAINPVSNEEIPIWIADYVLASYGTGAIMAVPAHDERDFEFAKKYNLPIKQVINPLFAGSVNSCNIYPNISPSLLKNESIEDATKKWKEQQINLLKKGERCFMDDGILINSGGFTGLKTEEAKKKMIEWLEKNKLGKKAVNYKLRDWVFSRQRYWGEPIPIIHCEKCGAVAVPEKDLPVKLPDVKNYKPTGTGESPLVNIKDWVNLKCPKCGGPAKRETNTMPQWAGSSWYYLAYIIKSQEPKAKSQKFILSKKKIDYWMPVDFYVGGAEHATRHLIYARFWHKFLYDIGVVGCKEPFKKLQHVGLILAEDGRKMSKRWGNVINPDDIVEKYGADSLRIYEMFMGPFGQPVAWNTNGLIGAKRFIEKIYKLRMKANNKANRANANKQLETLTHQTIKKVTEDIESFDFNTAISQLMILTNAMEKEKNIPVTSYQLLVTLLSPFAPHIAEELWRDMGNKKSIFLERWPKYNPEFIKEKEIELVIQINGKVRDKIKAPADISEDSAKKIAMKSEKIKKWIKEKEIKKVIFVKGKLVNIVV